MKNYCKFKEGWDDSMIDQSLTILQGSFNWWHVIYVMEKINDW